MKVFNTLSGQKEEFLPQGDVVKMYVCGVTPYDDAHIGHAMSYIIFDVIRRYLQFQGYKVKYVQNVTDIDDKIIDRANKLGISTHELAEKYTSSYFDDIDALNIGRADKYPRATEEISKIIEVIQGLVDKGYAYPAGGSVYFRVRNVADYGKLSHRSPDSMMAGECGVGDREKEDAMDFVLWKASKKGEPSWTSPWGPGRPGWHIECSAMSLKYLGDTLDIHGGGQDLVFPHHENEIAQSESFTGVTPFAKYWLHNGLLQFGEEKMSKSLGNLITIREALEKYSADAIRVFIIGSHYRSPLTYSEEGLEAAEKGADRLRQAVQSEGKEEKIGERVDIEPYRQRFIEAMDDDFNTAQALAVLFDLAREINRTNEEGYNVVPAQKVLLELAGVLGLSLKPLAQPAITLEFAVNLVKTSEKIMNLIQLASNEELKRQAEDLRNKIKNLNRQIKASKPDPETLSSAADAYIGSAVSIRNQLREARQWQLADDIRAKLEELGMTLEDTPGGTVWKPRR